MEAFLRSLEETALSQWVLGSISGYPIVLSFHSLGLALLVGLLAVIALKVLGFMPNQPYAPFRKFMPFVWWGFAVNLVSGVVLTMKSGDVAAMPADIRHQGFSRKRSMLLVWENATPELPDMYETGKLKPYPVEF